ncbi:hypothetical protein CEP53_000441 [Fusarium sp. AF-6]|nr:hypothetical protein CEP53_000441 [Fusarium sp. AF-6]
MSVAGDGPDQLYRLATEGPIDAIYSDYLAEVNIAMRALEIREHPELGYETAFLTHLGWKTAAAEVVSRGIKVVHNGGALNPRGLYEATTKFLAGKGLTGVKIAWVDGDNVTELVQRKDESYQHLDIDDLDSAEIGKDVLSANAYIGMRGILAALNAGAQIVICGRCCDASPPMALAAWWHGWRLTDWDRLAGSLVAGHVTKCGPYSTGGNFCGFKAIPRLWEVGHPIAEIEDDGSCVVTMHEGSNGAVTVDTITAQLVYEIQGPAYLNPDVTAILDGVELEGLGPNRVRLSGVKGILPPPTTKLAICALGGYQAEVSTYAVGLDIEEKAALQRKQILGRLNPDHFSKTAIDTYGSIPEDPLSQKDASVQIRHFIQAPTKDAISEFKEAFLFCAMQGYGGYHLNMDLRTLAPKPFVTYFPGKIEQSRVNVQAHLGLDDAVIPAPPLGEWRAFTGQLSYDSTDPVDLAEFGDTKRAPLGKVVLARSGDKGGNANVGLWVRRDDEWPWLRLLLTIDKIKHLLGNDYKPEFRVERFELPKLRAVHFVIYGLLEDGVSSSSLIDGFAKSVGEFIRARQADVPTKFLSRPHAARIS